MAVDTRVKKGIKILFKKVLIPNFHKFINKFIKERTQLKFKGDGPSIFVSQHPMPKMYDYQMVYGVGFLYNIFKYDGRTLTRAQFELDVPNIKLVLLASFFHESAHLVFSDMKREAYTTITDITRPDGTVVPKNFVTYMVQNLWNVIEDIVIERAMAYRYRSSKERRGAPDEKSLGSILIKNREFIIGPGAADYVDRDDFTSLLNYLLCKLSLRSAFTKNNNFFDTHKENKEFVDKFLLEKDGVKRVDIAIEYVKWILSTDLDISTGAGDGVNPFPDPSGKTSTSPKKVPSASALPMPGGTKSSSSEDEEVEEDDTDDKDKDEDEDEEEIPSDNEAIDNDLPEDIFGDLNDPMFDWSIHRELDLKNICKDIDLSRIKLIEEEMADVSEQLVYYFQMLIEKSRPSYITDIQTGSSLNLPAINRGERLNIFKELIDRSKSNISGIVLLCDNSGSMSGLKSVLLQKAVVAMSLMMNKLKIDNAVYAFSDQEDNNIVTYKLKGFEDDYDTETVKNTFNLLSTQTFDIVRSHIYAEDATTFHGNEDGYHIEYLSRMLLRTNFDNKIFIVFSDGMPMSDHLVKAPVNSYGNEIKYIGVGLVDSSVKKFYANHKVFSKLEHLEYLPEWLGNLLLSLLNVEG